MPKYSYIRDIPRRLRVITVALNLNVAGGVYITDPRLKVPRGARWHVVALGIGSSTGTTAPYIFSSFDGQSAQMMAGGTTTRAVITDMWLNELDSIGANATNNPADTAIGVTAVVEEETLG